MTETTAATTQDQWQRAGIHWHLYEEEHHPESKERFVGLSTSRLERREKAVGYSPDEVVEWMAEREREYWEHVPEQVRAGQLYNDPGIADWLAHSRLRTLRAGKGVGGGVLVSPSRIVDLWAVELPVADCPRHQ